MAGGQPKLRDASEGRADPARGSRSERPNGGHWTRRARRIAESRIVLALGLFVLLSCAPATTTTITTRAATLTAFETRLGVLSGNPVIQRAAQHRLALASRDPAALPIAVTASNATPESVRLVLAGDVDDVVIVAWLVSFGAMGAWTAFNPRNSESVFIPVSDIPALVARSPRGPGVYRLRDQKHLMLVQPVVVGDQAVGAVGFVLTQTYADPALAAEAAQLV